MELEIEEVMIEEGSPIADKVIKDTYIKQKDGFIVVAIKRKSGEIMFNPSTNTQIRAGDKVAAIGEPEHFSKLEEPAKSKRTEDLSDESLNSNS